MTGVHGDILVLMAIITASYVLGSIPFGVIAGRLLGVDITATGSGNPGATNAFRALGLGPAVVVLILDALKGLVAVHGTLAVVRSSGLLSPGFLGVTGDAVPWLLVGAGLAAIAGHNWSIFLGFKGGKGVATSGGVALYLIPREALLGVAILALTVGLTRFMSLGSIMGSIAVLASTFAFGEPLAFRFFAFLAVVLILYRHRMNIGRLIRGQELRLSWDKTGVGDSGK